MRKPKLENWFTPLYPIHYMKLFAFLDTNIFLHHNTIDHIDWPSHFTSDEIVLVVTPVVIRELNRHKDFPSSSKTRNRAAASLKRLHEWLDWEQPILIRPSVELQFRATDPLIDFTPQKLSRDIPDDHLIATVLEFRKENPNDKIVVVTDDLGLKLKSRTHAIQTLQLPPSSRLPHEPDENEKRIKHLEGELRRFQQRNPVLRLLFSTGEDHVRFALTSHRVPSNEDLERSMAQVNAKYPKLQRKDEGGAATALDVLFGNIPAQDIQRYNEALDKFHGEYKNYLSQVQQFDEFQSRIVEISLVLDNSGTCPAEHINVSMHFPDGFDLLREDELPAKPKPPKAPSPPQTLLETMSSLRFPQLYMPNVSAYLPPTPPQIRNASRPSIRRSKSYDVVLNVQKIKHGMVEAFDSLYVVFEAAESSRSFTIDYRLLADNVPDPVDGQLHVVIESGDVMI